MRKFTKEITALIASVALGSAAGVGALSAASEEIVTTAGVDMVHEETVCTTELPPTVGEEMPPDVSAQPPTEEEDPPLMGFMAAEDPTEEEIPPLAGDPLPPDEFTQPTTEEDYPPMMGIVAPTEEEIPPLAGDAPPPDEFTQPTTEEDFPPVDSVMMYADGDINGDDMFNSEDVALFQRWLLNSSTSDPNNLLAADFNYDGMIDVADLCLMRKKLISQKYGIASYCDFFESGYSDKLLKIANTDESSAVITSRSELMDYLGKIYPERTDLDQKTNQIYNEEFFENNVLLLKAIYLPSTGSDYLIENVSYKNNKLIVDYTCRVAAGGCDVVGGILGTVIIPKDNYHADSVEWRETTIYWNGIKSGYIAVFNGEDGNTTHRTYVYKNDNGVQNCGFSYINADLNTKNYNLKITGQGGAMWTDNVFKTAEANNAYDYVTLPNEETKYTIEEFMEKFLMD